MSRVHPVLSRRVYTQMRALVAHAYFMRVCVHLCAPATSVIVPWPLAFLRLLSVRVVPNATWAGVCSAAEFL